MSLASRSSSAFTGRKLRHFAARPRLLLCLPVMVATFLVVPDTWHLSTRLLLAWNVATWLYIGLTLRGMAKATEASIRRHALMGGQKRNLGRIVPDARLASEADFKLSRSPGRPPY